MLAPDADRGADVPVGGFNGSDPAPSLEQFQSYVGGGKIHYFIATWVESTFPSSTVGGVTLYDLTAPIT